MPTPNDDQDILVALAAQLEVPDNPATTAPYPRGFALDLVLKTAPLPNLLTSYDLTPTQAKEILQNPAFKHEFEGLKESISKEGFAFKHKAAAQAEAYLELLWHMAHDDAVPSSVRADIVKNTVKWAALDQPALPGEQGGAFNPTEMINQMKNLPDADLEVQILRIISKKAPKTVGNTFDNGGVDLTQSLLIGDDK